jgi:EAL domain-containing protein (putative c-di-GMP-specific phosphodiesterase class I)
MPRDSVLTCANVQNTAAQIDKRVLDIILATSGQAVYQVPLSSNALADPAMPGWLGTQLRKHTFPCNRLQFLVSEIDLHSNHDQVRDFCASLAELGIGTVISDFGSALEPLPALAAVKPAAVRLDTLLTRDLLYSRQQQHNLVKLINAIHHQQVSVAATGLNDCELLPLLYELGVDFVQGDCLQPAQSEPCFCFPEEQVITLPG